MVERIDGTKPSLKILDELTGVTKADWDAVVGMFTNPEPPSVIEDLYVDLEPKDDRYYTPTIDEFHFGFEYEERREIWDKEYPGIKVLEYIWEPKTMHLGDYIGGCYRYIIECLTPSRQGKHYRFTDGQLGYGAYSNMVRVKYLDKEDVELVLKDLGCEIIDDGGGWKKSYLDGLQWWTEGVGEETGKDFFISKAENGKIFIEEDETFRFEGNIKNKSELIKILKQLGYAY